MKFCCWYCSSSAKREKERKRAETGDGSWELWEVAMDPLKSQMLKIFRCPKPVGFVNERTINTGSLLTLPVHISIAQ